MHFGRALDLSDIELLNINLLDTHLDLLDTDIPSKNFVCLQGVLKTSSAQQFFVFKDVFKTSCEMSSRYLQDIFKMCSQDVFKTS